MIIKKFLRSTWLRRSIVILNVSALAVFFISRVSLISLIALMTFIVGTVLWGAIFIVRAISSRRSKAYRHNVRVIRRSLQRLLRHGPKTYVASNRLQIELEGIERTPIGYAFMCVRIVETDDSDFWRTQTTETITRTFGFGIATFYVSAYTEASLTHEGSEVTEFDELSPLKNFLSRLKVDGHLFQADEDDLSTIRVYLAALSTYTLLETTE